MPEVSRPRSGSNFTALAYNLANFMRTVVALAERGGHWSLTTLREKLVKIGAKGSAIGR